MCCGVVNDTLMARVGPDQCEAALRRPHAHRMDFTGKPIKGLVYVTPERHEPDDDLAFWVRLCSE
jgi:hypothetical protein